MQAYDIYKEWLLNPYFDEETKAELRAIEHDTKEIEDRFFQDLAFGTGGLRGVLGAGTNRMNIYVVRRATQGLANYILSLGSRFASRGVVIAFDSRHLSPEFVQEAACVLASSGIKVYLYRNLRPVPQLSFSVRHLHACAGIMITASHNPAEYNGYKVYWEDGAQIANEQAKAIMAAIDKVPGYDSVGVCSLSEGGDQGLIIWLDEKIDGAFYSAVLQQSIRVNEIRTIAENYPIVYTPLHGTGNLPVRHVLRELGFKTIHVVPEQELPDPLFSTVTSPNPEDPKAFALALQLAEQTQAQLIIATDPDCDRVGVMVRNWEGQFTMLTGNQTGALLTNYILQGLQEIRSLPKNGMLITTIVTGDLGPCIAKEMGVTTAKTLTGFKYIGEKIKEFEQTGEYNYLFGYEESYGYLAGTHARDKDGVVAAMLVCETAAYYAKQGKSLYEVLQDLFRQYGCYLEATHSITLKGKSGMEQIALIMDTLRKKTPQEVAGLPVWRSEDYLLSVAVEENESHPILLPKENVIKLFLHNHAWVCVRPSGTEPKLKIYVGVVGDCNDQAEERLEKVLSYVIKHIEQMNS